MQAKYVIGEQDSGGRVGKSRAVARR